jgi:hypothetical protein
MPDEQQPRNIKRADVLMTEGFALEVDGRMKAVFPTQEEAQKTLAASPRSRTVIRR